MATAVARAEASAEASASAAISVVVTVTHAAATNARGTRRCDMCASSCGSTLKPGIDRCRHGNDIGPYRCGNAVCISITLFCDVRKVLRATSAVMDVPTDEQELPLRGMRVNCKLMCTVK